MYDGGLAPSDNCNWQLADERVKSPPTSWDDSPYSEYVRDTYCVLRLRGTVDLTGAMNPVLEFYDAYELDQQYDRAIVSVSIAGTNRWNDVILHEYEANYAFERQVFDLTSFTGSEGTVNYAGEKIELRFVVEADDEWNVDDGWWIDDISIEENVERVFTIGFADDVEGDQYWVGAGSWAPDAEKARSGSWSWTDSPGTNYERRIDSTLELDGRLDLTQGVVVDPEIVFWHSWDLNSGDEIYLELSTDRVNWQPLRTSASDTTDYLERASTETQFVQETADIPPAYHGLSRIYVRFRLYSNDDWNTDDGWWIDDIEFRNKPTDAVAPTWCDDMESGTGYWVPAGEWGLTSDTSKDGLYSFTDSPSGDFAYGSNATLELQPYVDLSAPTLTRPVLEFWHFAALGYNSRDDIHIEVSTDEGENWDIIWSYEDGSSARYPGWGSSIPSWGYRYGNNEAWNRVVVELTPYLGIPAMAGDVPGIKIRFRLDARSSSTGGDGWYIDDVCIRNLTPNVIGLPFADDLEAGTGNWIVGGDFQLAGNHTRSGSNAFSDSPSGEYQHDEFHLIELKHTLNLNGTTEPTLYYWQRYDVNRDDYVMAHIQVVNAQGAPLSNWEQLPETEHYRSTNLGWTRMAADLTPYAGQYVRLRFELDGLHNSSTGDGWQIDDISVIDRVDEIEYRADPYYEDFESIAPGEWVPGHTWDTVQAFRDLGSGGSLGPGQWTVTWYDDIDNGCSTDPGNQTEIDLGSEANTTVVDEINFDWGGGRPWDAGLSSSDTFGAIFRRSFVFTEPRTYAFTGEVNNGIRIYDNGNLIFQDNWLGCSQKEFNTGSDSYDNEYLDEYDGPYFYTFNTGTHDIEVHYYESGSSAMFELGFAGESTVFHDSPDGDYEHLTDTWVELEGSIDLSGLTNPVLFWEQSYDIDYGDSIRVEVSTDEGFNWSTLYSRGGRSTDWNWRENYRDLTAYAGQRITLRFRLDARSNSNVADGWWIDNVRIVE
ncbi:MAG: hypothetical protein GYB66_06845 [Chloroflexi bacterium]|nr:hypothetical protein [Chloroflexota bacterium]